MWKGAILVALAVSASAEPFVSGRVTDARGPVAAADVMVVRLDADYEPVAGAHASLPLDAPLARAVTDESGAFRIDAAAVPAGFHALALATPGAAPILRFRERIAFGPPALPADLELRAPATATVRGIALDEAGAPVAAIRVVASAQGAWGATVIAATADAAGRFELAVPQDATLTLATMTADRFGIVRAPVGAVKDVTLAVHLSPLQLVEGVTTSLSTGRPVAGLRVRVQAPTWDPHAPLAAEADQRTRPWGRSPVLAESATGDDGRYSVRIPPEGMAFMTSPRTIAGHAVPGRTRVLDGEPLRGTIVDASGPIEGALVRWLELPDVARSDAQGRFELTPDVNAAVLVTTDDGASRVVETPAPGMRVVLPSRSTLRGSVRAGDEPVAGATVRASAAAFDALTATDASGAFALSLRGATRVTSRAGDVVVTVDRGDAPATSPAPALARAAGRTLRVQVLDAAGQSVEGAIVRGIPADLEAFPESPLPASASGRDGVATLLLGGVAPVDVLAVRPGMARTRERGVKSDAVTIRMARGAILRGVVSDADGRPVGGAAVVAEREDAAPASLRASMRTPPERRAAMTLADGAYVLRDMPSGTHAVEAVAFEHVSPPRQRVTLAAGATVALDFVVGAGATLRGLVHDEAGPVAGARVAATAMRQTFSGEGFGVGDAPRVTYSIADGTFAIDGLDPDQWYAAEVSADWHAPEQAGGRPAESVLDVAMRATGSIEGVVVGDATDAYVACKPPDVVARTRFQASHGVVMARIEAGRFSIDTVPPGIYECETEGRLAKGAIDGVEVRARATTQVTLRLRDKPSIVVEVVDARDGRPIAGAHVRGSGSGGESGPDGRVRLALPEPRPAREPSREASPGDEEAAEPAEPPAIAVMAEGYSSAEVPLPAPPPKSVTLKLEPLPVIRGRVVDAAGRPAAGAEILRYGSPTAIVSDADGRFELLAREGSGEQGGEEIGARRTLGTVIEEGSVELLPLAAIEGEVVITLARIEPGELTVVVRDASGPVVGARVSAMGEEAEAAQGVTNAEGRCVAADLRPGDYGVLVETETGSMAMRRAVAVHAGEHAVENFVLGEGWTVEGTVIAGARPVEGAVILWTTADDGGVSRVVMSHADGSFRAGPIPSESDEASLLVRRSDGSGVRRIPVRRGGPPVVVNVAAITVTGRVLAGDAPVAEARVVMDCGESDGRAVADRLGVFAIEDVAASSSCSLLAGRPDGPLHVVHVDTPAEGHLDLGDVRLEDRLAHGRVMVPEGEPASEITLHLMSPDGKTLAITNVTPGPGGSFSVILPAGPLIYVASMDGSDLAWASGTIEGDASLDLAFVAPGRIEITALRSDGRPADAWARVESRDGVDCSSAGVGFGSRGDDDQGPLVIEDLPPGHLSIAVASYASDVHAEIDLAPGESRRITVTLP